MFKFVRAACAATTLLLVATPAAAEPFQSFLKACVTTDGGTAGAVAVVGDLGWKPIPAEFLPSDGVDEVRNLRIHSNFDPSSGVLPDQMEMLMTGMADGKMVFDMPGVTMELCGIMAPDTDAATLTQQVSSHFGGPPQLTEEKYTAWVYSRRGGRITLEQDLMDAEDEVVLAALRERPLFAIYVVEEDNLSGLMLGVLRATK